MESLVPRQQTSFLTLKQETRAGPSFREIPFLKSWRKKKESKNMMFLKKATKTSVNHSAQLSPFELFEKPVDEFKPGLEPADPDFYKLGFIRQVTAYGLQFMEGPDGFGVYASKDIEARSRARVIMEIPMELMITISMKPPWMFFPDFVPLGHPIFDIINSTNLEDWDLRLACLLLYAFDCDGNFWQHYGDFLPDAEDLTSFLLSTEEDLLELQDQKLADSIREKKHRVIGFYERHWHSGVLWKIKRLARKPERFLWAVGIAQSRCINLKTRIGARVQDTQMLVPYADMLNHSFEPNCFFHFRAKDRMLEVLINAGQKIKRGDEMTINYMNGMANFASMERYGFSFPTNEWDILPFSGNSKIHLESFLSAFNIAGISSYYHFNSRSSGTEDHFVDGAVLAAARTLPSWAEGDMPPIPSTERTAVTELQEECRQLLEEYPTTAQEDQQILDSDPNCSRTLEIAIKYRMHRKMLVEKCSQALDLYLERMIF